MFLSIYILRYSVQSDFELFCICFDFRNQFDFLLFVKSEIIQSTQVLGYIKLACRFCDIYYYIKNFNYFRMIRLRKILINTLKGDFYFLQLISIVFKNKNTSISVKYLYFCSFSLFEIKYSETSSKYFVLIKLNLLNN